MPVSERSREFNVQYDALRALELQRAEREARMLNALEILCWFDPSEHRTSRAAGQFVRATAREGLGRET